MIFYLVEAILLLVLSMAILLLLSIYRELKRQNEFRREFGGILVETSSALQGMDETLRRFDKRGSEALNALGARISQARAILAELDRRTPPACAQPTAHFPDGRAGEHAASLREDL